MTDLAARLSTRPLRVLVACEFSGVVREAFRARGHDAWSCDLLDCDDNGAHIKGDVLGVLDDAWDLMIAHPPCTHLAVSGARWFKGKEAEGHQNCAIAFVRELMNAPIKRIALENPIGVLSTKYRKPDQVIQPWQFGHKEMKATCLWLRGLPKLQPTNIVGPPPKDKEQRKAWARVHRESPGPDRWKRRSITYQGIADAMAEQWGSVMKASILGTAGE